MLDVRAMKRRQERETLAAEANKHARREPDADSYVFLGADGASRHYFARSLLPNGLLGPDNPWRQRAARAVTSKPFDHAILFFIVWGSIAMGMADYACVYHGEGARAGGAVNDLKWDCSWENRFLRVTDRICSTVFLAECVTKIFAMGFYRAEEAYLKDGWNKLDFVVVVTGLLNDFSIPGMPSTSALRVFRVLRPLRSLHVVPGIKVIIEAMLGSIEELLVVIMLLGCIFIIFAILGMQLFMGAQHARCRATPFPVTIDYYAAASAGLDAAANASAYRCLDATNLDTLPGPYYRQDESPWFGGVADCYWPLADLPEEDDAERVCSLEPGVGFYTCPAGTWCGSNYDARGNARFKIGDRAWVAAVFGQDLDDVQLTGQPTFNGGLNYGYTTFDNLAAAFLTIFQSVTLEGWTPITYQLEDASGSALARYYMNILFFVGGFFAVNLLLAVLENNFSKAKEAEDDDKRLDDEIERRGAPGA